MSEPSGRVALVTGASSGIGRELALIAHGLPRLLPRWTTTHLSRPRMETDRD
jgi:NADP-dependent 3-hydroxy acid dehydrogenase YdfG